MEVKGAETCGAGYKADGQEGKRDLVVETSEAIILLEVKKKSLTRRARAGSDIAVLLDLAEVSCLPNSFFAIRGVLPTLSLMAVDVAFRSNYDKV